MGKKSRTRRSEARKRAKRAMKAQRRAYYESLKGTSRKSKKVRVRTRAGISTHKHLHLVTHCGNVGCGRCFPQFQRQILNGRVLLRAA